MPAFGRAWRTLCRRVGELHAQGRQWLQEARRTPAQAEQEALRGRRRAERKAHALLLSLLNAQQRQEFELRGHFHVIGAASGERYRIRVDSLVNIDVMCSDGTVKHHLCARPAGDIPVYDVLAGQLLYLQDPHAERRFLAQAKSHPTFPRAWRSGA